MAIVRVLIAALMVASMSCGGCGDGNGDAPNNGSDSAAAPSETEFIEPSPGADVVEEKVETLLAEFEPLVDETTRQSVADYVEPFQLPSGLEDPVDAVDAYLAIGEAAFLLGSSSGATWAFLQALALDSGNPLALSQLAFILTYEGRYADARPFLLHAASLEDELHTIFVTLAHNYAELGEFERCAYYLELAVVLQPENGHIRHKLGQCYYRAGWQAAGDHALEIALRLAPYAEEINETLQSPPESEVENEDVDPFDTSGGSEDTAGSLIEEFNTCFMQYTADLGEYSAPYSGFGGRFDQLEGNLDEEVVLHNYNRTQCEIECANRHPLGGERDACEAGCLATQCGSDSASFGVFRRSILAARVEWASGFGSATSGFAGCAWSKYFKLRRRVPKFEAATVQEMIWTQLDGAQETRVVTWDDVDERIRIWEEEVQYTCSEAAQAILDVDWENPVYFDPFKDLDVKICSPLLDSFCLRMTNTTVTVSTPISITSPVNLELTFDARTGKFNATVTVPLKSKSAPGDVVSGAANLKLDMQKGVGVQTEGKVGGPLNKTWTSERWLFTPR